MNATAKLGLFVAGGICLLCVLGKSFMGDSAHKAYVESLNKRPYNERDLSQEYGIKPYRDRIPGRGGPLAALSSASSAAKVNNCLEAEASRIQIEFEDKVGVVGSLLSIGTPGASVNPSKIARRRFEDQGLLPKRRE